MWTRLTFTAKGKTQMKWISHTAGDKTDTLLEANTR